jgi:transcriptional repressor NrdR
VEQSVRATHGSQVAANEIGLAILDPLRRLNEVAYLRFASVYKSFRSADDFEEEIRSLRALRTDGAGQPGDGTAAAGETADDRPVS